MADIFIYNLTTIGSIDAANDWMIIEDTSVGETKKAAPGQLPISTATQAALDTKVDENAPIVAATKTKLTYDAKGLVTAGADLSASDMPTGIDAAKISTGSISNIEFDYLNGLSDNIQTQLNGKQQTLTLTTTGTSGAATLVSGTLNIPQYSAGASGVSQIVAGTNVTISPAGGTGVVTINATGGGGGSGTVTNVSALTLGTTGTDLSSTVANSTTTPVITLNVPTASAANRGALSAADWTTFNAKQQALSTVTTAQSVNGQVLQNFIPNVAGTAVNLTLNSANAATYNSSVITLTGALTITFDASLPNGFNVTLIQLDAATSTIAGSGGLVIGNRQGHGKNNGQYSVVSIIKYTNVLAILGGDTSL
jgi:hypothetical protein